MLLRLLVGLHVLLGFALGQSSYVSGCATSVTFNFSSAVTVAQQSLIHDGVVAGVEYVCRKTGYGVPKFQVFVSPNNDDLIQILVNTFGYPASSAGTAPVCAISPLGGILINSGNTSCWQWTASGIKAQVAKVMAHEYFHQVQRNLAGIASPYETTDSSGVALKGPAWFIEGSAELVGWMAMDDAGLRSFPNTVRDWETPSLISDSFDLHSQEQLWNPPAQYDPYSYVATAVDLLTTGVPLKLTRLTGFWDGIGKGKPWRQSFQDTFGTSLESFYAAFDSFVSPFHAKVLSLTFIGAGQPVVNSAANGGGIYVPYSFALLGASAVDYPGQLGNLLRLPSWSIGWGSPIPSQIEVFMSSDSPSASYTVGLNLPDGRSTSATFPVVQTVTSTQGVPQPAIAGITPGGVIQGSVGLSLDIRGSGYLPGSTVLVNGQSVETSLLSATELKANVPASLFSGAVTVRVSNSTLGGASSAPVDLSVADPHVIDIDQTTADFNASGGTGKVLITAKSSNDFWAASTVSQWITWKSGATGTGSAAFTYSVAPNTSPGSRTGSLSIGGRILSIRQEAGSTTLPNIAAGGVVSAAAFTSPVAPGSFVTIYGSNFTKQTTTWDSAIVGGALPTVLGGVSVKINGKDCFMYYASPSQLSVLTPQDGASGVVPVEVANAQGSASATVSIAPIVPALFTIAAGGSILPVAVLAGDGDLAASAGSIPGVNTRPAKAGDILILFAEGLGPTAEPYPDGQVLTAAYPVAGPSRFTIYFGGVPATPQFVGLTFAGVYQINVQVPNAVPTGLQSVVLKTGIQTSQGNLVLPFSN